MSAKRFIIQDERVIKDNQKYVTETGYVFSYKSDAEEVCKLLNELHEENQALKSNRARYEEECRLEFKELSECENEQLKKEIERITKEKENS